MSRDNGTKSIVCRIDDLLDAREMTLTELAQKVGITYANLSVLKNNHAKAIRFSTLEALCDALQCEIGELLEYKLRTVEIPISMPEAIDERAVAPNFIVQTRGLNPQM